MFMWRILVTDLHGVLMSEADDFLFFHSSLEKELLSSLYTDSLTSSYIVISDKKVSNALWCANIQQMPIDDPLVCNL